VKDGSTKSRATRARLSRNAIAVSVAGVII
jgi:hypothetical protein